MIILVIWGGDLNAITSVPIREKQGCHTQRVRGHMTKEAGIFLLSPHPFFSPFLLCFLFILILFNHFLWGFSPTLFTESAKVILLAK